VVSVPLTADGIDTEQLELALQQHPSARLLYVIPTFQNPTGVSLAEQGRRRVVDLAQQYGVLIMEDDPYGLLRFEGEPAATLHQIDGGDNVVYSSSFTKTVAPGIRAGYLVLPERLVAPLAKLSENTYIAPNTFAEATLAAYCRAGRFEPNVERITGLLRARRDAMEAALRAHFPEGARWTTPQGGYFYWVDLPATIDTGELLAAAAERGVPLSAEKVGAKMVGRWPSGASMVVFPDADPGDPGTNDFGYHEQDQGGVKCPAGAHVRRSNPRDSSAESPEKSLISSKNHRILRRGRPYGLPLVDPPTQAGEEEGAERGLLFLCLNSDFERQFEFVQHTWLDNAFFAGLCDEVDPVVGPQPENGGIFTVPDQPVRRRFTGVPRFVNTVGGAYFFLPGIKALQFLASIGS